jgi:hypothetical protein
MKRSRALAISLPVPVLFTPFGPFMPGFVRGSPPIANGRNDHPEHEQAYDANGHELPFEYGLRSQCYTCSALGEGKLSGCSFVRRFFSLAMQAS